MYAFLFDIPGLFVPSEDVGETLPDSDTVSLLCDVLSSRDGFVDPASPSSLGFLLAAVDCLGLSPEVLSSAAPLFFALEFLATAVCLSSRSLLSCCDFAHSDRLSGFYNKLNIKIAC